MVETRAAKRKAQGEASSNRFSKKSKANKGPIRGKKTQAAKKPEAAKKPSVTRKPPAPRKPPVPRKPPAPRKPLAPRKTPATGKRPASRKPETKPGPGPSEGQKEQEKNVKDTSQLLPEGLDEPAETNWDFSSLTKKDSPDIPTGTILKKPNDCPIPSPLVGEKLVARAGEQLGQYGSINSVRRIFARIRRANRDSSAGLILKERDKDSGLLCTLNKDENSNNGLEWYKVNENLSITV